MTRRPGAYGIVRRDGAVLLIWDQEDQRWYFPGGGIEAGETPEEALAREVTEETGFRLLSCTPLVYAEQSTEKGVTKECRFFLAEVDDADPGPAEHELEWVPLDDVGAKTMEDASRRALALATPSLVTTVVDDLTDPIVPDGPADHRQAVADAGVFHVVEVGGRVSRSGSDLLRLPQQIGAISAGVRVVAANIERGGHLDAWADLLLAADPDVVLLSEVDGGMARSGNRYVARELAGRLGAEFAFAVEFVELGLGGPEERKALPADARNEFGVHGGTILSRVGLDRPAAVRFEFDGWWFGEESPERRIGGRLAMVATVGDIVVVAPHLESHGGPEGRARQMADLLDLVDRYADGRPVIVGGDLNTHTLDLGGGGSPGSVGPAPEALTAERFLEPFAYEPLFAEAAGRGYGWEAANLATPTHRTASGRGDLNLDWFLTRGLTPTDPEVIPAVDADGHPISDHDVLAVTIRPT